MRLQRLLKPDLELLNMFRRHIEQRIDQVFAVVYKKFFPHKKIEDFDGQARFALITVNFSTTYYLKLMLLTLCEQNDLHRISKVIIVDNHSRDGGRTFLEQLSSKVENLYLVKNNFMRTHARGLRKGVAFLNDLEDSEMPKQKSNLLLVCDTDIIFRNKETLTALANVFRDKDMAFAGELRYNLYPYPEAQASFFALRRDIYARPDIVPFVHHGAPAYWMQRSLWRAGFTPADFPSNQGNYILHRGRSAVSAAHTYEPMNAFATAHNRDAHYMGVADGVKIWENVEQNFVELLQELNEKELIDYLANKLQVLGKPI